MTKANTTIQIMHSIIWQHGAYGGLKIPLQTYAFGINNYDIQDP